MTTNVIRPDAFKSSTEWRYASRDDVASGLAAKEWDKIYLPPKPKTLFQMLKEDSVAAYEAAGGVEYLKRLAVDEPATFVKLLQYMLQRG